MSSSALIAARKRVETSLKKFEIISTADPEEVEECDSGVLYLSLLKSRLNWSTLVFIKYKADAEQQPRRAAITRKKWPSMKYIGTCTLHIGPHSFEDTIFYKATRSESWNDIIAAHQNAKSTLKNKIKESSKKRLKRQKSSDTEESNSPEKNIEPMEIDSSTSDIQSDVDQINDTPILEWTDIVFELKDVPSERYIFPKECLVSVDNDPLQLRASFTLPLDPNMAEEFFEKPINKILKYGHKCDLEYVQNIIAIDKPDLDLPFDQYESTNMLLSKISKELIETLMCVVDDQKQVKKILDLKADLFPKKRYIKYSDKTKMNEIKTLLNRVLTMPDLLTGPIMAEKKRNEILNAIKLGKRERDEKFEAELPKTKLPGVRDESVMRCAYCATKFTNMWRSGPGGHGTLCNSCGIQWKRKEILEGASMIDLKEERRILKEKRERERQSEALEIEKVEKEGKKQTKKQERSTADMTFLDGKGAQVDTTKIFAAQLIQQRQAKQKATSPVNSQPKLSPTCTAKKILPSTPSVAVPANIASQSAQPYTLYSSGGIPLPTLSVDFGGTLMFFHPNCGITLLDSFFSVRLCKDGHEQMLIQLDKKEINDSTFQVLNEGDAQTPREVLKMTIVMEPKMISVYGNTATVNKQCPITVRFLEKLDPNGGAVVQRILQRWLTTFIQ